MAKQASLLRSGSLFYYSYLLTYRSQLIVMLLLFMVKHACYLSYPLAIKYIIDDFVPQKRIDLIFGTIGFVALMGLINYFLHRRYVVMETEITKTVSRDIRNRLVHKLQMLTFQYHAEHESGRYFSKIMVDVEKTERFAAFLFNGILGSLFTVLISAAILLTANYKILLLYIGFMPGYLIIYHYFQKRFSKLQGEARKANEDLGQSIAQFIQTNMLSKIHGEEEYEKKKIDDKNISIIERYRAISRDIASFGVIITTFSQMFLMIIIAICAISIIRGNMTLGALVLFLNYITQITSAITNLVNQFPTLTEFAESVNSVKEILDSPDEELNVGKQKVKSVTGALGFDHVSFSYDHKRNVLDCISLEVTPGQTIALIGPSGSGKTTFVNLALGLLRDYEGRISVDGQDIQTLDMRTVRKRVGMVTQNPIFFRGTILENVAYGRINYDREQVIEAIRLANAEEFVLKLPLQYDSIVGEMGATLSGGQKQRLAIARAIFRQPSILILDEATSALDAEAEREVQKGINSLIGRQTTFVIAHRLSTIFRADVILVFENGKIVEKGNHNDLIDKGGIYTRMLGLQMGVSAKQLEILKI